VDGMLPSYETFFSQLREIHPEVEIARQPEGDDPAIIIAKNPEKVIETMIALTAVQKVKLEWLNIRKSTLEDVFIQTVSPDEGEGTY